MKVWKWPVGTGYAGPITGSRAGMGAGKGGGIWIRGRHSEFQTGRGKTRAVAFVAASRLPLAILVICLRAEHPATLVRRDSRNAGGDVHRQASAGNVLVSSVSASPRADHHA